MRTTISSTLDVNRLAEALSRPGIDPRRWVTLAVVTALGFDPAEGVFVDVTTLLGQDQLQARYGAAYAGDGFGLYLPLKVGDEVLVGYPDGDPGHGLVVLRVLQSPSAPPPAEFGTGDDPTESLTLIVEPDKSVLVKVSGGGNVEVIAEDDSKVALGGEVGGAGMEPAALGQQTADALDALNNFIAAELDKIKLSLNSVPAPVPYIPGVSPVLPDVRAEKVEVK